MLADRLNDLYGVLNGVDPQIWNPKKDFLIVANYSITTVAAGKAKCKTALQEITGLEKKEDALLFCLNKSLKTIFKMKNQIYGFRN